MYSNTLVVVLCVLGVVKAYNSNNDLKIIDTIRNESPCSSQGGICTIATDCKAGALTEEKGLCPAQRNRGIECCYGLSEKETRCGKRGGECMKGCNQRLFEKRATDCPKDTICCILVK